VGRVALQRPGVRLAARPYLYADRPMPPDFLNSREDAVLLWSIVLFLVFFGSLATDPRGIGASAWGVIRSLFVPKLLLLFGSAAAYSAAIVLLAERLGLWHMNSLKETVYWFVGSGLVLVARAVDATPGWGYVNTIFRSALALTILITFVANFYALPLGYEIVLVFVAVALTLTREVAPYAGGAPAVRPINGLLTVLGFILLITFVLRASLDPGDLLTRETAERFLVVPVLTLALTSYLLGVAWYCRREVANIRRRVGVQV
jgi:hypothetical protein